MAEYRIIIPSRTIENLLPCVEAVLLHEPDVELGDIVVVDDGVEWQASPEAAELFQGITAVPGAKPFIFARNCNIGIKATAPRIDVTCMEDDGPRYMDGVPERDVILLNDDALLESDLGFSQMVAAAQERLDFGIIGATTNITGQPLQKRAPNWISHPSSVTANLRAVPHIAFVCVLIPARTLRTVGLLDEQYALDYGCDDADYCEAVTRKGLKVGVHDGCFVDHGSLRSTFRGDPKTPKSFRQNLGLLIQKWGKLLTQPGLRA
jgi:GT2 family glycosyltransferase